MFQTNNKILMVFVEPTPYILDLISALNLSWPGQIDLIFLKENFSQQWNLSIKQNHVVLSPNILLKFKILYRCFFKEKYQIIFLAGWIHPFSLITMILSKFFSIPIVVDSDTPLLNLTPQWKRVIKRLIYPYLFKLPSMFLPAGTRQANYLAHYNVPPHKITIEQMTVDVVAIQKYIRQLQGGERDRLRKEIGLKPNDFVFLFTGRLIERKGIRELLQAFEKINIPQAKLIIVGDGPLKPYVEAVEKRCHYLYFAGWLEKNVLMNMFFISDVFVLPAHWEPWGLVINEAMAAGKPVIVTDQVGCVDDLIIPGKTGIVIKNKSIDELIDAIIYFCTHPIEYNIMSKHVLEHISHWTLADEANQICLACKKAISSYS